MLKKMHRTSVHTFVLSSFSLSRAVFFTHCRTVKLSLRNEKVTAFVPVVKVAWMLHWKLKSWQHAPCIVDCDINMLSTCLSIQFAYKLPKRTEPISWFPESIEYYRWSINSNISLDTWYLIRSNSWTCHSSMRKYISVF